MSKHLELMDALSDRLRAMLIAITTEDFANLHNKVMDSIKDSAFNVAAATERLLTAVTEYTGDGELSAQEKETSRGLVLDVQVAARELSIKFDKVRKSMKTPISQEMLCENFLALTLSSYARLVWEYAENIMDVPPAHQGLAMDV